jgi:hypothetical protein
VQAGRHQRDPARSADQQDSADRLADAVEKAAGLVDGAVDEGTGEPVEFLARQVQRLGPAGHGHRRDRGARQHLLGDAHLGPERPPVPEFGRVRRP